jgi:DNA-binding transcriptional LysR family regulator
MFENRTANGGGAPPSLNALRAFEAMARTGSATAAGEELSVTHSAVSRQVKALEAQLGVTLFEGPKHRLRLTGEGAALLPRLTQAFDGIAAAVRQARGADDRLVLAVNASLSVKWLIPRLPRFAAEAPEITVDLIELAPNAYSHRDAHAILRLLSEDRLHGAGVHRLLENRSGPVAAPSLLARLGGDWRAAPRLTSRTHPRAWTDWCDLTGEPHPQHLDRSFAHLHFAADAARAGLGVAVLPWVLVADEVAAGTLAPVGRFAATDAALAVAAAGAPGRPLRRFVAWLRAEAKRLPPAPEHG